jgi:hypothetical protein
MNAPITPNLAVVSEPSTRTVTSWNPRRPNQERIGAAVSAYRRYVEPTDDELGRLEAVMYIRTL